MVGDSNSYANSVCVLFHSSELDGSLADLSVQLHSNGQRLLPSSRSLEFVVVGWSGTMPKVWTQGSHGEPGSHRAEVASGALAPWCLHSIKLRSSPKVPLIQAIIEMHSEKMGSGGIQFSKCYLQCSQYLTISHNPPRILRDNWWNHGEISNESGDWLFPCRL